MWAGKDSLRVIWRHQTPKETTELRNKESYAKVMLLKFPGTEPWEECEMQFVLSTRWKGIRADSQPHLLGSTVVR